MAQVGASFSASNAQSAASPFSAAALRGYEKSPGLKKRALNMMDLVTDAPTEDGTDAGTEDGTNADTLDATDPYWEPGTNIYEELSDGWYFGVITTRDDVSQIYNVAYKNGETATFAYNDPEFDVLVDNAENYVVYDAGTKVQKEVDGGFATGQITIFQVRQTRFGGSHLPWYPALTITFFERI